MYRSRLLSAVFVLVCFAIGGTVLHSFQGPLLRPASAQSSEDSRMGLGPATPQVRRAAVAAIQAQLTAFGKGDYRAAIKYQSADLKQNFSSPDAFRHMMEGGYPEFVHSKKAVFGLVRSDANGQRVLVPVTLTGQDGITVRAAYLMVREGKNYRVQGVLGGGHVPVPIAPEDAKSA